MLKMSPPEVAIFAEGRLNTVVVRPGVAVMIVLKFGLQQVAKVDARKPKFEAWKTWKKVEIAMNWKSAAAVELSCSGSSSIWTSTEGWRHVNDVEEGRVTSPPSPGSRGRGGSAAAARGRCGSRGVVGGPLEQLVTLLWRRGFVLRALRTLVSS